MTLNSSPMYQRFRRFLACEDGNSTIEALFFYIPIFLFLLASIEIGILSTRHVLLERGVYSVNHLVRQRQPLWPIYEPLWCCLFGGVFVCFLLWFVSG